MSRRDCGPELNRLIIHVGETGDLVALLNLITSRWSQMNLVNYSTCLHRMAKMPVEIREQHGETTQRCIALLLQGINTVVVTKGRLAESRCQTLCNIVWSMSTLGVVDMTVIRSILQVCERDFHCFKAFELLSLLGPLSRLSVQDPQVREAILPIFQRSVEPLRQCCKKLTFHRAAVAAWSYAAVMPEAPLFEGLAHRVSVLMQETAVSPEQLAHVIWGFRTAKAATDQLLATVALKVVQMAPEIQPRELNQLVGDLATDAGAARVLQHGLANHAAAGRLSAGLLCNVLLTMSGTSHEAVQASISVMLPAFLVVLEQVPAQELVHVLLSVAVSFGGSAARNRAVVHLFARAAQTLRVHVAGLSDSALVHTAAAYIASTLEDQELLSAVVTEALHRGSRMAPQERIRLTGYFAGSRNVGCGLHEASLPSYQAPPSARLDVKTEPTTTYSGESDQTRSDGAEEATYFQGGIVVAHYSF